MREEEAIYWHNFMNRRRRRRRILYIKDPLPEKGRK
jgi:hypothetical protein